MAPLLKEIVWELCYRYFSFVLQTMWPESGFRIPKIGGKSGKWQSRHNFPTWGDHPFFWGCFVSLVKFNYWSKFHVNIITGSGVITIFFYKGLAKNAEIGNTPIWFLPNICWLDWVRDTEFGTKLPLTMIETIYKYLRKVSKKLWKKRFWFT